MSCLGGPADITIRVQSVLRYPLQNRIYHLNTLAEQIPFKELQTVFPEIVNSIFGNGGMSEDWNLRTLTHQNNPFDFRLLHEFLSPTGGLFKIIYKLIGDPQTRYTLPVRLLPIDLYDMLQSKRIPKFYFDTLVFEPQNRNVISLSLNPFDFYIFHFAIHLCNSSYTKSGWDNWNTLYYTLACDYLLHFLPRDPNCPVLPYIPYFTGKTPVVSPLQTVNSFRQCQFPSLFTCQEMAVNAGITSTSTQLHPRGEMWRSETVLQVFTDVWLNKTVQTTVVSDNLPNNRNSYPASEHVRITRLLVKQCHCFAMSASSDLSSLGELRRITTATLAPRAVLHIQHLMHTWPLDSSFRLVLELWFSFIQPWRYANIKDDNNDPALEDNHRCSVDRTFLQFISENLPAYTEIFQLVMPRFLRLDLTVPKNAIMLFRLTKVFSQNNLIQLLKEAESSATMENDAITIFNNNLINESDHQINPTSDGFSKYSLAESVYFPAQGRRLQLFGSRQSASELMLLAQNAHKTVKENIRIKEAQSFMHKKGILSRFLNVFLGENDTYDDVPFEELKKVPLYLNSSIQQLAEIFSLSISENNDISDPMRLPNDSNDGCIRRNAILSPQKAKERSNNIKYMGDPDLEPIKTFENGFLVMLCRYISSKVNEMYSQEIKRLWEREDLIGSISKQIVQKPLTIHHYGKDRFNSRVLITETLPPRISLRGFASHKTLFWITLLLICTYFSGHSVLLNFALLVMWMLWISFKGCFRHFFGSNLNSTQDSGTDGSFLDLSM